MELNPLTILTVVFVLSCLVGYFVVWGVTPALHTPLMAVTNAISGIVVVAAIVVVGPEIMPASICDALPCPYPDSAVGLQWLARILGFLAVVLCSINIFGGFAITSRMLAMFKPKEKSGLQAAADEIKAGATKMLFMINADMMVLLGLVAAVLFVLGLKGLAHPKTARNGNKLAMAGMLIAVVTAMLLPDIRAYGWIVAGLAVGAAIGIPLARRTPLTALPQLVAGFHSFIGLAAALVAVGMYVRHMTFNVMTGREAVEMAVGAAIGMITFSGSIVAALKLQGIVGGKPWVQRGQHVLNLLDGFVRSLGAVWFVTSLTPLPLVLIVILAGILGVTLVAAVGGADMPVIVSMLNSYSGWAAAATGFMLEQPVLIMTGALVGASGAILSYIMCKAMNRSILSVIFGGFGAETGGPAVEGPAMTVREAGVDDAAYMISNAQRVIIVPGYGMAVAQAQHAVKELFKLLGDKGIEVAFAIHPVAGRMPGHMNVLLAEADIPYDAVHELEEINPRFKETDVVLVLGANDVVNPAAQTNPGSPIYGMPVLEAWKANLVYVVKRSHRPGYAGVDNPLFGMENCSLVLGDAKAIVEGLVTAIKAS